MKSMFKYSLTMSTHVVLCC